MRKLILVGAMALPLAAMAASLSTQPQQAGYAMGYQIGMALKNQGQTVDANAFDQGFADGYKGKTPQMSQKQQESVLRQLRQAEMKKMVAKIKAQADKNAQMSAAFLAANAKKPGVKTLSNGLQYKVLKTGTGPSPTLSSVITVNYEGRLMNGKVFDASANHGGSASFTLKNVIPGWQKLMPMMKQGGTWMLYIPAKYAYGANGAPGLIGPNEALIFKVSLLKVKN